MFTWLNNQGVRSSDGFELQFTGRFSAEYRENGRAICLDVEPLDRGVAISESSLRSAWQGWPEGQREQQRARILENMRAALEFQNLIFELSE